MANQSNFEKTVYEVLGCLGGSVMGLYMFAMIIKHGFAGISFGIPTAIKIGMGFSMVMMLATVLLSVRRFIKVAAQEGDAN